MKALAVALALAVSGCAVPVRMVVADCEHCVTLTPEQLRDLARKLYDAGFHDGEESFKTKT